MIYTIVVFATVPQITSYSDGRLFCNTPCVATDERGSVLYDGPAANITLKADGVVIVRAK